jgi:hypothetical protein
MHLSLVRSLAYCLRCLFLLWDMKLMGTLSIWLRVLGDGKHYLRRLANRADTVTTRYLTHVLFGVLVSAYED